jgi:hypothetical protein
VVIARTVINIGNGPIFFVPCFVACSITDYACERVSHTVGTGQYFRWIEDFTTSKISFGINLIPVTVSQ